VSLFVDTSVWSLALRRDAPVREPEVGMLIQTLEHGETVLTTGLVLQELLQDSRVQKTATGSSNGFRRCR
jgi:predicted nucleic acid-binding protein